MALRMSRPDSISRKSEMDDEQVTTRVSPSFAQATASVPIKVLALLHIALASAGLIAGISACVSFWLIPGRFSNTVLAFAIPIFLFFAIFVLLPELAGGIGLLLGRAWGRVVIFLISIVMLFVVPIGTILGAFGFWVLLSEKHIGSGPSGSRDGAGYDNARPTAVTGTTLAVTLLCLTALGAAGVIVLNIVFRFQEIDPPSPVEDTLAGAAVTLPVALIVAGLIAGLSRRRRRPRSA